MDWIQAGAKNLEKIRFLMQHASEVREHLLGKLEEGREIQEGYLFGYELSKFFNECTY